jgi:adenosylcobinamide-GDP ribazoletransferase
MRVGVLAPLAALQFLSIIPVRLPRTVPAAAFPNAVVWLPVIGGLLAEIVALVDLLLAPVLPASAVAAIDLALLAVITGGLHLDGLADAADGLLGNLSRERRLDVMREGGIGAFGAAALCLTLLVEYGALVGIAPEARPWALVVAACISRWGMSLMLGVFPYARAAGAGTPFRSGLRPGHVLVAAVVALGLALLLADRAGVLLFATGTMVALAVGVVAMRRIGGCTGDVYGAGGELAFAAVLVAFSGLVR